MRNQSALRDGLANASHVLDQNCVIQFHHAMNLAGSSTNGSCPDSSIPTSFFDGAVSALE